jgi:hypothetical protein
MFMFRRLAGVVCVAVAYSVVSFGASFTDDFESYKVGRGIDTQGPWEVLAGVSFPVVDSKGDLAACSAQGKLNISVVKADQFTVLSGQSMLLEAEYNVSKGFWLYGVVFLVQDEQEYYELSMSGKGQEIALFRVKGKDRKELFKEPLVLGAGSGKITVSYDAQTAEIAVAVSGVAAFSKTVKDSTNVSGQAGIFSGAHIGYHVTRFSVQTFEKKPDGFPAAQILGASGVMRSGIAPDGGLRGTAYPS